MRENLGFTERCIAKLQRASIHDGMYVLALNDYVMQRQRLVWDNGRALFWVNHPSQGWQVAVWMMPIAELFEPVNNAA